MQSSTAMRALFYSLFIAALATGASARLLRGVDDAAVMGADQFTKVLPGKDPRKSNAVAYSIDNLAGARNTGKSSGIYMNRGNIVNAGALYPGPRSTTVVERSSKAVGAVGSAGVINWGRSSIAADDDGRASAQADSQGMALQSATDDGVSGASSTGLYKPSKSQNSGVATTLKGATSSSWSGIAGGASVAANAGDAVAFAIAGGKDNGR